MIREIRLHGVLAEKYGESHSITVNDFVDVANYFNSKGLVDGNLFSDDFEVNMYSLIVSDGEDHEEVLNEDTCVLPFTDNDLIIDIIPAIEGENSGIFQIIGGAALIVAGGLIPGAQFLIGTGVSLVIGGASTLLAPTPSDASAEFGSQLFNGQVNSNAQQAAIPLIYGEVLAGSIQISAGLSQEDLSEFDLFDVNGKPK